MTKVKAIDNTQQLLFLQSILIGMKEGTFKQTTTMKISVNDKENRSRMEIEIYPNSKISMPYRFIKNGVEELWRDWEDKIEIEESFKGWKLI